MHLNRTIKMTVHNNSTLVISSSHTLEMGFLAIFLFSSSCFSFCHASIFSPDFETKLQTFIDASIKCRHVPGMTLSVVKGKISKLLP